MCDPTSFTQGFGRAGGACCANRPYLVRGFCEPLCRRQRCGFCSLAAATRYGTCPMGAGSVVPQRGGASCAGGNVCGSSGDYGRSFACHGRVVGDGGRVALSQSWRCDWRDLGRSALSGFYRNQATGLARRGRRCALLVDPQGGQPRSQRCARTLAYYKYPLCPASARSAGPRRAALGARSVSRTPYQARPMGGQL